MLSTAYAITVSLRNFITPETHAHKGSGNDGGLLHRSEVNAFERARKTRLEMISCRRPDVPAITLRDSDGALSPGRKIGEVKQYFTLTGTAFDQALE